MLPHQANDLANSLLDIAGHHVFRHDLAERGRARIVPAADPGKRKIAVGDDAFQAIRSADQHRTDMIVGHGARGLVEF